MRTVETEAEKRRKKRRNGGWVDGKAGRQRMDRKAAGGRTERDAMNAAMTKGVVRPTIDEPGALPAVHVRARGGATNWIHGAIKHPGALHRELGVPQGQKIPEKKLEKAERSDNPTLRRRANLAKTLKGMH